MRWIPYYVLDTTYSVVQGSQGCVPFRYSVNGPSLPVPYSEADINAQWAFAQVPGTFPQRTCRVRNVPTRGTRLLHVGSSPKDLSRNGPLGPESMYIVLVPTRRKVPFNSNPSQTRRAEKEKNSVSSKGPDFELCDLTTRRFLFYRSVAIVYAAVCDCIVPCTV